MKTSDFYYDLPKELIAQHPEEKRDHSRLMVLDKYTGEITHRHFYDMVDYLRAGDCLVLNDSRVIPARLIGERISSDGGKYPCELLLLRDKGEDVWETLAKPGRKLKKGVKLIFGDGLLEAEVVGGTEEGNKFIKFTYTGIFMEILEKLGRMPLPPYITEYNGDGERYQTVYSKNPGSAAAPTAGLHFTPEILKALEEKGVMIAYVTLHVGLGTFRPVTVENIDEHVMHSEFFMMPEESAEKIKKAKKNGGRVIAVGTTSCRTLESAAGEDGSLEASSGWTNIFIYPGYKFKLLDGLITNFHLPESTLIMLVSALAGKENVMHAYHTAVEEKYRFFSFGDAMLILSEKGENDNA
ncbi:MAG: tRNA preQ1(34) S-adenosylmethionine ribosyltransferase-isomerase QueA [Ruminococcaceae bacterium]|nr:tRNA preQ1(34) S-adenosylmethionine ribosyltransferase-isomerase QueA [Oscillospiraceae bacterium]